MSVCEVVDDIPSFSCFYCQSQLGLDEAADHLCFAERGGGPLEYNDNNAILLSNYEGEFLDLDELVITAIQRQRPLFDHRIPVGERSKLRKEKCWSEVFDAINGVISVEDIKKKWRYLRDKYLREKKSVNVYKPSGSSAASRKKSTFKYFDLMRFLDDVIDNTRTFTNVPKKIMNVDTDDRSDSSSLLSPPPMPSTSGGFMTPPPSTSRLMSPPPSTSRLMSPPPSTSRLTSPPPSSSSGVMSPPPQTKSSHMQKGKKRKQLDQVEQAMMSVLENKEQDEVGAFCFRLAASLRRLSPRKRAITEIKLLQVVYEAEYEN